MEDYHGYNRYGSPQEALKAYYSAHREDELPKEHQADLELGLEMFDHYHSWLQNRKYFDTLWRANEDGERHPLVEVYFEVPLPYEHNGEEVVYAGTLDRLVKDEYGRSWILDYKTAKRIDTSKLEMDPQVSAYAWAADQCFPEYAPFEGMVYMQFLKAAPRPPRTLVAGGLSVARNQNTTYNLYRQALIDGKYKKTPEYSAMLKFLLDQESEYGDKFIRMNYVRRNEAEKDAAREHIFLEVEDMLNPDINLYPNPTKDCAWDCPFKTPCVAMDDGSDWEYLIQTGYTTRADAPSGWRSRLEDPHYTYDTTDEMESSVYSTSEET